METIQFCALTGINRKVTWASYICVSELNSYGSAPTEPFLWEHLFQSHGSPKVGDYVNVMDRSVDTIKPWLISIYVSLWPQY